MDQHDLKGRCRLAAARAGDERTIVDLAREALSVQDACNLSGVVHSYARAVSRLRALLPDAGTEAINQHPICQLWADKCSSLAGVQAQLGAAWVVVAYRAVRELARAQAAEVVA